MRVSSTQWTSKWQNSALWDGFSEKQIIESIQQIRLNQRDYYCEEVEARWELYHNRSFDVTWAFLQQYYPEAARVKSRDGNYQLLPILYPVIAKVVHHVALTFLAPPSYRWTLPDGTAPTADRLERQNKIWAQVVRECGLPTKLRRLEEMVWLCSTAFAQAAWRRGHLALDVILPSRLYAVEGYQEPWDLSDASEVCVLALGQQQAASNVQPLTYTVWTPSTFEWKDGAGQVLPNSLFPDGSNGYGLIPCQAWHLTQDEDMLYPAPDEVLLWSQVAVNLAFSDTNNAMRKASYGQRVFKSDDPKIRKEVQAFGPDFVVSIGENDDLVTVNSPVDPNGQIARMESMLKLLASAYEIPYEEFNSAQSALAKLVQRWDIRLNSLRHEKGLLDQAAALYGIIAPVWNYHHAGEASMLLDPELVLEVVPGRIPMPKDDLHAAQADERRYAANVKTPIDDIMAERGLSEADARRIFEQNKAINEGLRKAAPDEETPYQPMMEDRPT